MANDGRFIVGFIHVYMVNEFADILIEQITLMQKSGLYDRVHAIHVCCLGTQENKEIVENIIRPYSKINLALHSTNETLYEFATIVYLKKTADLVSSFYGFYIHSKGVTWPGHEGGKYWRDYMNHYIINKWKANLSLLEFGYDTCGVKMINKTFPLHYSGNYFWFNSDYIKMLIPINKLDRTNRFNAEMWVCSGQPICATLCQDFVDYNSEGVFKPKM